MKKVLRGAGFVTLTMILILLISACMTTRTDVGEYREMTGRPYRYASGKQIWLFWGILPLGRTNVNTPSDGNCQVVTQYTPGDFLVNTLTCGVVKTYTIRIKARRE